MASHVKKYVGKRYMGTSELSWYEDVGDFYASREMPSSCKIGKNRQPDLPERKCKDSPDCASGTSGQSRKQHLCLRVITGVSSSGSRLEIPEFTPPLVSSRCATSPPSEIGALPWKDGKKCVVQKA